MKNDEQTDGIVDVRPVFAIVIYGERSDTNQKDDKGIAEELKERFEAVRRSENIEWLNSKWV